MSVAAKFGRSVNLLQQGHLDAAEALCREVLLAQPSHADAFHVLGVISQQKGHLEASIDLIQRSLALNPAQPHVHCNLGNAYRDSKRPAAALECYQRALALAPGFAGAHYNEGNVLADLDRPHEALMSFDRAIALQPDYAEAHQNRGNVLLSMGRHGEALTSYQAALRGRPDSPVMLGNVAFALRRLNRPTEAMAVYERISRLSPGDPEPVIQHGNLLLEAKRHAEAIACFDRVLLLRPAATDTLYNRGQAELALEQFERALADFDAVVRLEPDLAEGRCSRGRSLLGLERHADALVEFEHALQLRPRFVEALDGAGIALRILRRFDASRRMFELALEINAHDAEILYRLAVTLREAGLHEEAANAFARVVLLDPGHDYALGALVQERGQNCDWTDYAENLAALEEGVRAGRRACLPGPFLSIANSGGDQLLCARSFVAATKLAERSAMHTGSPRHPPHRRIRVAYVSADFRDHPVAHLLAGVLESHDRGAFDITGVSLQPAEDSVIGRRIRAALGEFVDVACYGDREIITLLRELEIDIAVDLMGFSGGSRPAIFAARVAPVQINYLGYSGSTGAPYMDYIIADHVVIPAAGRSDVSESVAFLPCFQPNEATPAGFHRPTTRALHGLPEQGVVFCCFNGHYKISPHMFATWMRILAGVEGSVLWLSDGAAAGKRNLQREASRRGVAPERLIFAPRLPDRADHLARYALSDLFLDTLPYNAHTTASDALRAGLPLLTCEGGAFAGRVAASLLARLGMPELIVPSLAAYESLATELALQPGTLERLRSRLAANASNSPLFDSRLYCRALESAFRVMSGRAAAGEAPQDFDVPAG